MAFGLGHTWGKHNDIPPSGPWDTRSGSSGWRCSGEKWCLTPTPRKDSSGFLRSLWCFCIIFRGRNSQLSEEAGRGAAGPVISHSWLTVMTDFSFLFSLSPFLCPKASAFTTVPRAACLYSSTQLITPKTKLCEQQRLLQGFAQEKELLLWNKAGAHSSEAVSGGCWGTVATRAHSATSDCDRGLGERWSRQLFVCKAWLISH